VGDTFSRLLWHVAPNEADFTLLYNMKADTSVGLDSLIRNRPVDGTSDRISPR